MKDKNLPNNYHTMSLEDLTEEANKMIKTLEKEKNLESSIITYQSLLQLNGIIEKKFQKNNKLININTKKKIEEIILKKDAK